MKSNPTTNNPAIEDATDDISSEATLELWVRSGGRCARCNAFLLEDALSEKRLNLGERAHIVGRLNTSRSPRGVSTLPVAERNNPENLILLCLSCHKTVDDKKTRDDFPVERLLEMKRDHEDRIHVVTGISPDRETAVLRIFGMVRGSMPELARQSALQTVMNGAARYARFPFAADRYSIELDLSAIPDPEAVLGDTYWKVGCAKIDEITQRISYEISQNHARHLSIFALARIPLLVYLGFKLDDKIPTDLYQKQRGGDEGWLWPEDDVEPITFETNEINRGSNMDEVVVILSLSGTIGAGELPEAVAGKKTYEIRPHGIEPNRDLFRSKATLDAFSREYHDLLSKLETLQPKPQLIHLFLAAPITAAIACGRGLMRHVHPAMVVYDRINNIFEPTIILNES
jgi:hypothetical protein